MSGCLEWSPVPQGAWLDGLMGPLTWQDRSQPLTIAARVQCLGIPSHFGLQCEHSLQTQPGTAWNCHSCSLCLEWRVWLGGPPGLGKAPWATGEQVTQISCWPSPSWIFLSRPESSALGKLLRGKEEMTVRKCLVLGADKWQEMPLNHHRHFFMSCNSETAGERLARVVRNSRKKTPQAPMTTNPSSFTKVGRRRFRENPPPTPTCTPVQLHVVPWGLPLHRVWGALRKPYMSQPCSSGRQAGSGCRFWIFPGCQVSCCTRTSHLSVSCRKMGPDSSNICHLSN